MPERPLSERFEQWWNSHPDWQSPATGDPEPYRWALAGAEWLEAENERLRKVYEAATALDLGITYRKVAIGHDPKLWADLHRLSDAIEEAKRDA